MFGSILDYFWKAVLQSIVYVVTCQERNFEEIIRFVVSECFWDIDIEIEWSTLFLMLITENEYYTWNNNSYVMYILYYGLVIFNYCINFPETECTMDDSIKINIHFI